MLWYVVQVRTGEERDIAAKLTDMGFQTLAPVENRPVRSGGAWGTKEYVLFPGYVFLQMDYNAGNYYRLKAVPGIVKLLSGTLTYLEAEWIRLLAGQGGIPLEPTLVRRQRGAWRLKQASCRTLRAVSYGWISGASGLPLSYLSVVRRKRCSWASGCQRKYRTDRKREECRRLIRPGAGSART